MELTIVDQLQICLVDQGATVPMAMRGAGYTQDEISEAWTQARALKLTEPTGLGMDRLTEAGKARAADVTQHRKNRCPGLLERLSDD